jgi:restriction system protein
MMRSFMVRLGRQGAYIETCLQENFVGVNYDINVDLTGKFPEEWRECNAEYIPLWLERHPGRHKVAAGLACAATWTLGEHMRVDDVVLSPNAAGDFHIGRIAGPYKYDPDSPLPHQRPVTWEPGIVERSALSEGLRRSVSSALTVVNLTTFTEGIKALLTEGGPPDITVADETVEDPATFALELHLEDFLLQNWALTPLGKEYDIYSEDGEVLGRQFPTDTGRIDILAISKDRKRLLVVELKRGRASDSVVGQIQRYMGYIKHELLEPDQTVQGVIIALEDDIKIRRALAVTQGIDFYRYEVSFKLLP